MIRYPVPYANIELLSKADWDSGYHSPAFQSGVLKGGKPSPRFSRGSERSGVFRYPFERGCTPQRPASLPSFSPSTRLKTAAFKPPPSLSHHAQHLGGTPGLTVPRQVRRFAASRSKHLASGQTAAGSYPPAHRIGESLPRPAVPDELRSAAKFLDS